MAATISKQKLVTQLFSSPRKGAGEADADPRPILEEFIYGLCRENTTPDRANKAYANLRNNFFDWNEVRVSSIRELEEAFSDLPKPAETAQRVISFLQEVFETTFTFDLECLQKKGVKPAAKQLARFQAADDYVVSWVVMRTLGGHEVPLDEPSMRVLQRMRLIDGDEKPETLQSAFEHLIPKAKAQRFCDMLSELADELCLEDEPNCSECPLAGECPTGLQNSRMSMASTRSGRMKPR